MNKIKQYRIQKHLTQRELADLSGVKYATVTKLESGVNSLNKAEMETGFKLAKALGIPMEYLMDLETIN
jgi:transcriptional regulator with XRE-family HTH domain